MRDWPFDPARERHVSLATFRRDGRAVLTPVWIAELDARYYVFSAGQAGKVKRIRANGAVRLAACDFRGRIRSDWLEARATRIDDAALIARVYASLRRKYGAAMWIGDFFATLTGRFARRAIIEIEVTGPAAASARPAPGPR